MALSDIANLVEIIGVFAIVFGIAFGLVQLRQHRKQSRDMAIVELARSFEDPEFSEAYVLISSLKPGKWAQSDHVSARDPDSAPGSLLNSTKARLSQYLVVPANEGMPAMLSEWATVPARTRA